LERTRDLLNGDLQIATVLHISEDEETRCWELFTKLATSNELFTKDGMISYVDCTNITLCATHNIEFIASFDGHYKGWLNYPS
jgi:predicted nucleic acid-binding protein